MNYSNQKLATRLANALLSAFGLISALVFCYIFYHYQWARDRSFANEAGGVAYYGIPLLLTTLSWGSLFLERSRKIKLSFVLVASVFSVYLGEALLQSYDYMQRNWPAEITEDTIPARANIAKRFGVDFDRRSRVEVIEDLWSKHIDAVPATDPSIFLQEKGDGSQVWNIDRTLAKPFALAGISNKTTVFCNENGAWTIYSSDEHGFHNPPGPWSNKPIDIAAVGDSFTHGACVPSEKGFVAFLRRLNPKTLNLGIWGQGPLGELAVLKEYLPSVKPKVLLWIYFEGNDVTDLALEQENPVLMQYLHKDFTQHLLDRQPEVDQELIQRVDMMESEVIPRLQLAKRRLLAEETAFELFETLKLPALRRRTGMIYAEVEHIKQERPSEVDPNLLAMFHDVLLEAKQTTQTWGGSVYFVYLPMWERYSHPNIAVKNRDLVLKIVEELHLSVIDLVPVFQAQADPLALFPFRGFGHYNEAGNELVANTIVRSFSTTGLLRDPSLISAHPNTKQKDFHGHP